MRVMTSKVFGELIREARKKSKLTQSQLAAASGIGERFVRELERGKATCQLAKALWVAQMLGIKFDVTLPEIGES